jgi:choline-sulfatase
VRILYIDIDTLRADHLGCYGYHRVTSPNIDRLAEQAIRFDACYASDVPCLPSRTAFFSGRFGFHTGVVGHGGTAAEPFVEGPGRGFSSTLGRTALPALLRKQGLRTATVSSFASRHSAHHFTAGFSEVLDPGKRGLENADEVSAIALEWLSRRAREPAWFLHVHLWDPHTPYRVPESYGEPFEQAPLPAWLTEAVRARHFASYGPHSAQEAVGFSTDYPYGPFPRQPRAMDSMREVRRMIDGYDTGVRYADDHVGRILDALASQGVLDDTVIVVSADHGETLGELNVYGDHHTADDFTARLPCILRVPGMPPRVVKSLCYQVDIGATLVELAAGKAPPVWDGMSLLASLQQGVDAGRDALVITQGAWTCQRGVRFEKYLYIHTQHDGYHGYPKEMLFDLVADPYEQHDLAAARGDLVSRARAILDGWRSEMLARSPQGIDPLGTVLREGGPAHTRGQLRAYVKRLRETGREHHAEALEHAHRDEIEHA